MPRKLPPYCEQFRDRHGRVRIYFRRSKIEKRVALPSDPTSGEFQVAYAAALAGQAPAEKKTKRSAVQAGTIAALVMSYLQSADYRDLRETTKKGYRTRIELLREKHGHRTLVGMDKDRIEAKILDEFHDRPGQRLAILKMLRVLIKHAIGKKWIQHDPSQGIKRPKTKEIRSWTDAEIAAFEAKWPIGSRERLAFGLMLFTGQRRSDVHRMTWADIANGRIRVVQQKTGKKLEIDLHRDLRAILAQAPREHVTILNTVYGQPFTVAGFSQFMREAIKDAELPLDCRPHGLRKAQGRRLAEAGCTPHEIMSVLGHTTLGEAERYTRDVDQTKLASSAIAKLPTRKANGNSQPGEKKFGKKPKREGK